MTADKQVRLIEYEPQFVKFLYDQEAYEIVKDEKFNVVLQALKDGPMTVRELVIAYANISGQEKSDKTIYRYLNILEKHDIVISAGQLVTKGKKTNETIYARTAVIYHLYPIKSMTQQPKTGEKIAEGVSKLLFSHLGREIPPQDMYEFLKYFESKVQEEIEKMGRDNKEDIKEYLKELDTYEINKIMEFSEIFAILLSHSLLGDQLREL